MSEAQDARDYWRTHHFQGARIPPRDEQPHRWAVAEHIAALNPESVLEFGCSSGRNLRILRDYLPTASLVGVDANPVTIQAGRDAHPGITFIEGDESYLPHFRDGAFDVVFTVSVLDHVPDPEWRGIYDHLVRIAKRAVVMLEPMFPSVLNLMNHPFIDVDEWIEADFADLGIPAAPFSFAHDYLGNDPHLRVVRPLPIPAPQWERFGQCYYLLRLDK